jgi:polysaccharide export outer membrane protein
VNVQPVKLRPFFILGEVRSPGQYAYSPGMSVLSAVSSAGGFTFRADQRSIVVRRTQNGSTVKGRADDTTPILPGDTIKVLEKWF